MFRRFLVISVALIGFSCAPSSQPVSTPAVNAGVNIVPEAVVASLKIPPSNQPANDALADVTDVISRSDQKHVMLMNLLEKSGMLAELRKAGPYTVFAPTDEAFDKLPPGVTDRLLEPSHHTELVAFVRYHLLGGRIAFADMLQTNGRVPTLEGDNVVIRGIGDKAMVNDANVIRSDGSGSNGVVYWIDSVLLPPA